MKTLEPEEEILVWNEAPLCEGKQEDTVDEVHGESSNLPNLPCSNEGEPNPLWQSNAGEKRKVVS